MEEKAQLEQQIEIQNSIFKKELKAAMQKQEAASEPGGSKFGFKGKQDLLAEENAKLAQRRRQIASEYETFKQELAAAKSKFDTLTSKIKFDPTESAQYKSELQGHIKELQGKIKTGGTPDELKRFKTQVEDRKSELKDVEAVERLADTIDRAQEVDRQYQARLNSIDELMKPGVPKEGLASAEKVKAIKADYARRQAAIKKRLAEINTELKNAGKKKAPAKAAPAPGGEGTTTSPAVPAPDIGSGDFFKAPVKPAEPAPAVPGEKVNAQGKQFGFQAPVKNEPVGTKAAATGTFTDAVGGQGGGETVMGRIEPLKANQEFLPKATEEALKDRPLKDIPESMRQTIKDIYDRKLSLVGAYKKIKDIDFKSYILKYANPSKITGMLSNSLNFFREIKLPVIS